MKVNTVTLDNNRRVFILEDFYDQNFYKELVQLFCNYDNDKNSWEDQPEFAHNPGRLVYVGNDPVVNQIQDIASSPELIEWLATTLNKKIELLDISLWLDLPGYVIHPHYDQEGYFDHAIQIYIPDPAHYFEMLGTCMYTDHDGSLFEIHYRPNRGYLLDKATTIMHGLNHQIPVDHRRHSIYMRYRS